MDDGNEMDVGIEVLRSMRLTFVLLQAVSVHWDISPFSRNGNPPMKTSTFATLGQSYLPTQPCSSLKRYEDIRGNDERQSHRVVRVAMFQLFQALKLRKFHTISQPISWRFRSSVSKLES